MFEYFENINQIRQWLIILSSLPNTRYGHPTLLPSGSMTFNNDLVFQSYTVYTLVRYTEIPTWTLLLNLIIISLYWSCIFKVTLDVLDDVSEGFKCLRKRRFPSQRNFNSILLKHPVTTDGFKFFFCFKVYSYKITRLIEWNSNLKIILIRGFFRS